MKIAIASPTYPHSVADALHQVDQLTAAAAQQGAAIICFPETYVPGYPLPGKPPARLPKEQLEQALTTAQTIAATHNVAIILPMDWYEGDAFLNVAQVISASGQLLGYQAKNQLDPSEDPIWDAGQGRRIFQIHDLIFGISICHEGFRYPETVRWAARRGAHIVFHPHFTGSDTHGHQPSSWGSMQHPYYEKAFMMRALENTIYFASSNYTTQYPESASSLIAPDGSLLTHQPYQQPGIFTYDIDLHQATGYLAKRWKPMVEK